MSFDVGAMVDFIWWARHVLGADCSAGPGHLSVWLYGDGCGRADVVFELNTGRVFSNYPRTKWLDAEDAEQWRELLLTVSPSRVKAEAYLCGRSDCCLFRLDEEEGG
jgi:hypothetical protein